MKLIFFILYVYLYYLGLFLHFELIHLFIVVIDIFNFVDYVLIIMLYLVKFELIFFIILLLIHLVVKMSNEKHIGNLNYLLMVFLINSDSNNFILTNKDFY